MTSTIVTKVTNKESSEVKYDYDFTLLGNWARKEIPERVFSEEVMYENEENTLLGVLFNVLSAFLARREVIIGLGSGRSGSMSLALLLAAQPEVLASHESEPRLHWNASVYEFLGKWAKLFYDANPPLPILADVAHWYLPFVHYIMRICPLTKFVCLKRDTEAIVRSYMLKVSNTSHWTIVDSECWRPEWIRNHDYKNHFPKYNLPKEEGCRRYVIEYYEHAEEYEKEYPSNFKIFEIESLNSKEGVEDILQFCGVAHPSVKTEIWVNRTGKEHEENVKRRTEEYGEGT